MPRSRPHRAEATAGSPAKEIEEEGLDLIVGLMGEKNHLAASPPADSFEKGQSLLTRRRFDRLLPFPRQFDDVSSAQLNA
jgi:hypothetical protein